MKRTTSFSEFSPPLPACSPPLPACSPPLPACSPPLPACSPPPCRPSSDEKGSDVIKSLLDRIRRNSIDLSSLNLTNAAHFLNTCGFCKRRIGPGIETFIYRGEAAFCSKECRDKRIREDRKKEKKERKERKRRSLAAMKNANPLPPIKAFELSA